MTRADQPKQNDTLITNRAANLVRTSLLDHALEVNRHIRNKICVLCPERVCRLDSPCELYRLFFQTFLLADIKELSKWN